MQQLFLETEDAGVIAARLNAEGWRAPKRKKQFDRPGVRRLLDLLGLRSRRSIGWPRLEIAEHEWTRRALAKELDMPAVTLHAWMRRGWVKGRRAAHGRWILYADPSELKRLRSLRKLPRGHFARKRALAEINNESI